jgi:hypothetical protein
VSEWGESQAQTNAYGNRTQQQHKPDCVQTKKLAEFWDNKPIKWEQSAIHALGEEFKFNEWENHQLSL